MTDADDSARRWRRVAVLSVLLVFFTLPHTLEDFALGEPQQRGVPAPLVATVVSLLFAAQALALYWVGRGRRHGLWIHAVLGALWPIAAGFAQLPEIVRDAPYRAGAVSMTWVFGTLLVGVSLAVASGHALRGRG